jgi:hypothetical protein
VATLVVGEPAKHSGFDRAVPGTVRHRGGVAGAKGGAAHGGPSDQLQHKDRSARSAGAVELLIKRAPEYENRDGNACCGEAGIDKPCSDAGDSAQSLAVTTFGTRSTCPPTRSRCSLATARRLTPAVGGVALGRHSDRAIRLVPSVEAIVRDRRAVRAFEGWDPRLDRRDRIYASGRSLACDHFGFVSPRPGVVEPG